MLAWLTVTSVLLESLGQCQPSLSCPYLGKRMPSVAIRSSNEYLPLPSFFFCYLTSNLCFYAWDIPLVCVLIGGPDSLRPPPDLESRAKEAEKQKQERCCSGCRAGSTWSFKGSQGCRYAVHPRTNASCCHRWHNSAHQVP